LFPAYSASGQDVWTPEYDFDCSAIVLSAVGARSGKTFKADGKWSAIANTHCLFPRGADRDFLWYLTNNEEWWEKGGTAQPFVKVSETLAKQWSFPPVNEQRAIAAFLDRETARIDALIEKKRLLIELLHEKRGAALSGAMLGNLDGGSSFVSPLAAWMGALPSGWKPLPIKYACSLLKDGTHLPPPRVSEGVPLLSVRNIIDGQFVLRVDDSNISEADYEDLCRAFVPRPKDVLLAIVGATIGKTALVPDGLGPFHVQRSLAVLRTRASVMKPEWLHLVFQTKQFRELLLQHVGYSAQPGIYLGSLANFMVPTPPLAEQEAICKRLNASLSAIDQAAESTRRSVALLDERRAALIAAAVTGQIDVREAA